MLRTLRRDAVRCKTRRVGWAGEGGERELDPELSVVASEKELLMAIFAKDVRRSSARARRALPSSRLDEAPNNLA